MTTSSINSPLSLLPKKRVIVHVCDKLSVGGSSLHGAGRLLEWWFPLFKEFGYHPLLVVLRARDNAGEYLEHQGLDIRFLGRRKFDPLTIFNLLKIIYTEQPALLHLHGYGAWTFGRIASRITRTPVVLHEHMVGDEVPFVISNAVRNFCESKRYIRPENTFLIPNGIPLEKFSRQSNHNINLLKERFEIPQNDLVVGSVGRLESRKGYSFLLRAVPQLLERFSNISIVIAGDGEQTQGLIDLSRQLNISERVRFIGYLKDVSLLLPLFDVFVIPSLSEGQSLALLEALASGCPVVSTSAGGLGEMLEHEKTALLVSPGDTNQLANAILTLLANPKLRQHLSISGQKLALERYDIRSNVNQLNSIYKMLV
jgi:glycosyltransferase involved in cell wall biosynthesis